MNFFDFNLKDLRLASGRTQNDMANYLNIGLRQYQKYERGEVDIPTSKLIAIADLFDVSIDYLVGRSDEPTKH